MADPYILIVGVGRSGTNWLFDLLDLSPVTHCRNATHHAVPDSLLAPLVRGVAPLVRDPDLGARWDAAVDAMAHGMGALDGKLPVHKDHFRDIAQRTGLVRAVSSRRLRRVLSLVAPALRGQEWRIPSLLAAPADVDRAVPVLRTGGSLSCLAWVLEERPCARVLHIVRHPGGFANSWQSRFLAEHDEAKVLRDNLARLREVIEVAPEWAPRFGDIDAMSIAEAELWFWRYSTETSWAVGRDHAQYQLVTFEALAADLDATLRAAFAHCGLAYTDAVAEAAASMPSRFSGKAVSASEIATAWRKKLDPELVALVDRILEDSPLRALWT